MFELRPEFKFMTETSDNFALSHFHPTFSAVSKKANKWIERFSNFVDETLFKEIYLLYLLASKKYLDHRDSSHLFRLVTSLHFMQKKLLNAITFSPHLRHAEVRWIPTSLIFPFSSKPVLGCLIGFNMVDRYDMFDEENILLALQKYLPDLRLVKESSYIHSSPHKNLRFFYLEIEKKTGTPFSLAEKTLLKLNLEGKVKNSIQTLSPSVFMGLNEEEAYKHVLALSQEINTLEDRPQAYITLDQHNRKEVIFRVILVHIAPMHRFSLKDCFFKGTFTSKRNFFVKHIENHPVDAHVFHLHLPREASLLRADGALDFYSARKKISTLIKNAVGEFRDFNGGIILKQHELLYQFKAKFPEIAAHDPELMETFFYSLTPIEKQLTLTPETLAFLFSHFMTRWKEEAKTESPYTLETFQDNDQIFLVIQGNEASFPEAIKTILQEYSFKTQDFIYNFIEKSEKTFFNCILQSKAKEAEPFIKELQEHLDRWQKRLKNLQILKIGLEFSIVSLDPRIGGELLSIELIQLLFEGLTRYNQNGAVENAAAESIEISPNLKEYTFTLQSGALWNNGSVVTAHDFAYSWKKILSPDFKTAFAHLFYVIKNAKEAKEGKVSSDEIGIHVINDRTLKVELNRPYSNFLQITSHPLYSQFTI